MARPRKLVEGETITFDPPLESETPVGPQVLVEVSLFTPLPDSRKAEDWQREDASLPWQRPRCRECNYPMYTREPQKHDLCEECGYLIRDQMQQLGNQQMAQRSTQFVNPFSNDPFAGTASLPVQPK